MTVPVTILTSNDKKKMTEINGLTRSTVHPLGAAAMTSNLKTKETLLRTLRRAGAKKLSAEELQKQRVSFVIGSLSAESSVTRAQVKEVLANFEGRKSA